ncbi:XRE family transcriptional regulator [Rubellimicrobium rubrum]|uniref:XRE family transcriptional regulator n=1 Tax=Rubellimicrobium rubrum TaxID=2585369 RepID=A0A5C4MVE1_9RHOB|nr:XRE family transcriptional regulator [Rubellimicrobium rubrum]TNC49555.1 XRE family transcriptional regulator [Rubellimicrobium rubrum]
MDGRLATFLRTRIAELAPTKSQKEIAQQAGYTNANMVTMLKQGDTKLALDRVAALAPALEVDPGRLYLLALHQDGHATTAREIEEIFNAILEIRTNRDLMSHVARFIETRTSPTTTDR